MPLLMSSWVVVFVVALHEVGVFGFVPWNAPCRNRLCMKAPMLSRILRPERLVVGSNTTHFVPRYRLSSRNSANRLTGIYFQSEAIWSAPASVRAPQHTFP